MEKLKERWGISSTGQIILIIIVFGLTGSSSVYVAKPVLEIIGLSRMNFSQELFWGGISYYALRIVLVFPIYQVLLVAYGWLFGQFKFFWSFEKTMLGRMGFSRLIK
ncbi:DUF6787 family protein [Salinimicrobium sp. GXAS 041]|uniref:DUF6787 family protein n=1 Tax=Salinimicrobium sp. GXAS 041 TaxID=3400806 RepID=UPI003C74ED96